jgi:glutamate racemase
LSIGIFDSGIGGLTVFKSVAENFPELDIYYLGDTARVPYGNKSKDTIIRYSIECSQFLINKFDIEALIIACNSASSYAVDILKNRLNIPVIGVINPGSKHALQVSKNRKIGVIGTYATINSNSYKKSLLNISEKEIEIYQKPCPLFVPLIEEGMINSEITRLVIKEYLQDIIDEGIDTLILGCTHYPVLKKVIKDIYPDITVVDSSEVIIDDIKELDINFNENGVRHILITDESSSFHKLKEILVGNVKTEKIELSQLCSL